MSKTVLPYASPRRPRRTRRIGLAIFVATALAVSLGFIFWMGQSIPPRKPANRAWSPVSAPSSVPSARQE